jgi:hypothetical protein
MTYQIDSLLQVPVFTANEMTNLLDQVKMRRNAVGGETGRQDDTLARFVLAHHPSAH